MWKYTDHIMNLLYECYRFYTHIHVYI